MQRKASNNIFVRYLVDVDDTLMVNLAGEIVYNQDLINEFKEKGITEVVLLTKMDAKSISRSFPLRVDLIEHLKNYDIRVSTVLTPADLLYRDTEKFDNFQPGEAYERLMRPVELALADLKLIPDKTFTAYKQFFEFTTILDAMRFLLRRMPIDGDQCLSDIDEEALKVLIEGHFFINYSFGYGSKDGDVDYESVSKEVFLHFNHHDHKTLTLNELIAKYGKEAENLEAALPRNSLKYGDEDKLGRYFSELKKYRNLRYHSNLVVEHNNKMKEEENLSIGSSSGNQGVDVSAHVQTAYVEEPDDKEEKESEKGKEKVREDKPQLQRIEPTKGDVYAWYMELNPLDESAIVFFIDDNKKEHESVKDAHLKHEFRHALVPLSPPRAQGFNEDFCLPLEEYRNSVSASLLENMKRNLVNFVNGQQLPLKLLFQYFNILRGSAMTAKHKGNYAVAIYCWKLAYLFSDEMSSKYIKYEKKEMARCINAAYAALLRNKEDIDKFISEFTAVLYRKTCEAGGFDMQMKIVQLNWALHRDKYPECYNRDYLSSLSSSVSQAVTSLFGGETKAIDRDFEKMVGDVIELMKVEGYERKKDECMEFLTVVKDKIGSQMYKDFIDEKLKNISLFLDSGTEVETRRIAN